MVEEYDHRTYPPLAGNPLQNRTDEELIELHDRNVQKYRNDLHHLIQTIRKEVEGIRNDEDIRAHQSNDNFKHYAVGVLDRVLNLLNTLEKEV